MPDEQRQEAKGMATPEEMQAAIEASGYLLEGQIARAVWLILNLKLQNGNPG